MTEADVLLKLEEIFRDLFDLPDLQLDVSMSADDIDEWDSVNHVMLVVQVEREFKIKFHTAEVEEMKNVGDLVKLVVGKLGKSTPR
ncbi:MAG: acyl carrier protein [Massilia sp.]|jgi:acyl carrier protein|uniref:acyl carrier protein n=1 Tax=Massilia sp. TaxID=1882437 RepID=UPI002FC6CA5C